MKNLKSKPYLPTSAKGDGYFFAFQQKRLMIDQFGCMQIFRALAKKWRIWKINPICQFNPPSTYGGGYFFLAI